jgi:hypothetical protein
LKSEQQPGQVALDLAEQVAAAVDLAEHEPLEDRDAARPDLREEAGVRQERQFGSPVGSASVRSP